MSSDEKSTERHLIWNNQYLQCQKRLEYDDTSADSHYSLQRKSLGFAGLV